MGRDRGHWQLPGEKAILGQEEAVGMPPSTNSPETMILVRMLRYQGRISEENLRQALNRVHGTTTLLEVLRTGELVEADWLEWAGQALRRKMRRFVGDREALAELDCRFGQLLLGRGWIDVGDLESGILEQQRLRRLNLRFRIGEILVRQGVLEADQVRAILADQGFSIWSCTECEAVVNRPQTPGSADDGVEKSCPICSGPLRPSVFLESVRSDVVE